MNQQPWEAAEWLCLKIVEESQDAVIFADAQGIIRLWNTAAARIFGYAADEALGQSLDLIIPERLRERHWQGYRQVMAGGLTKYGLGELLAVPGLRRDGAPLSLEFSLTLIRDDDGRILGAAAILRDVTDRWAKEKELKARWQRWRAKSQSTGPINSNSETA